MSCDLDNTLPEWLMEHPETEPILIELGFDPSCGGKSLEYQCRQHGLNPHLVLSRLLTAIRAESREASYD